MTDPAGTKPKSPQLLDEVALEGVTGGASLDIVDGTGGSETTYSSMLIIPGQTTTGDAGTGPGTEVDYAHA